MQLFYTPEVEATLELPEEEAAHCVRVLRLLPGAHITLTDGKGSFFEAEIQATSKHHVTVNLLNRTAWEKGWQGRIHLAVAPTKNMDRMEWLAEKVTEVGIDELSFLNCRFSERKVLKLDRIRKIVVSAMKQSLKGTMPCLNEMVDAKAFIKAPREGRKFIAHCQEGDKPLLRDLIRPGEEVTLLIGPEGDFSPGEVTLALQHGYEAVSLGSSRLRTETAALSGVMTLNTWNQNPQS